MQLNKAFILLFLFLVSVNVYGQDEIRFSIYFEGCSYAIDEIQQRDFFHWLDSIPNKEKYEIHLISHTDPIGGKRYNEWLSDMRSQMVEFLMLQKEIPKHKITKKNWGLENAVYSNQTYQGMRMNRRVDIIFYPILF
jgi:outer membrane protein OmpA-like peptidoglycan-associated protein